jgi:hypothetical protein
MYLALLIGNLPPSRTLRMRGADGTRRPRFCTPPAPQCGAGLNPIAWIQGLQGLTLVAIICAFLFLEETGVPIPFAPGDLLLAIAGIAIAAGRVNPAVLVACAFVAIVTGAGLGREAFAVLGWDRLMKVAGPLHARVPLERASAMLQRNGWRAVFTARLIPGLRVHTTEVAGVSRMPRLGLFGRTAARNRRLRGRLRRTRPVLGAFLIYRSLPAQPAGGRTLVLDVGEAFAFAFRSRRSPAKIAVAAACLLFSWLLFPLLLFVGYTVSVARSVRAGATELPAWDDLRGKLKDGALLTVLLFAWTLPGITLGLPADLAGSGVASHGASWPAGALSMLLVALAVIGSLWGLFVLVAQGAIWSQYLRGGFRAGLNVAEVFRRVRFNLGLTFVVAALVTVLAVIGFGGLLALLLGVLVTLPYCSWVGAYLLGRYASITDEALLTRSGSVRESVTIR